MQVKMKICLKTQQSIYKQYTNNTQDYNYYFWYFISINFIGYSAYKSESIQVYAVMPTAIETIEHADTRACFQQNHYTLK